MSTIHKHGKKCECTDCIGDSSAPWLPCDVVGCSGFGYRHGFGHEHNRATEPIDDYRCGCGEMGGHVHGEMPCCGGSMCCAGAKRMSNWLTPSMIERAHRLATSLGHIAMRQGNTYECPRCGLTGRISAIDGCGHGDMFTKRCA